MTGRTTTVRAVALLAGGALAIHQLRYGLGFGGGADRALAGQGHAYFPVAAAVVVMLLAVAAGQFLAAVTRTRRRTRRMEAEPSPGWLAATVLLLAIYAGQESLEGFVFGGHPGGLGGVFGDGGWIAVPLAIATGKLVALVLRRSGAAIERLARVPTPRRVTRPPDAFPRPARVDLPRLGVLAANLAGRSPPGTSV